MVAAADIADPQIDRQAPEEGVIGHVRALVAKPELTFIWQSPTMYLKEHPRNQSWEIVDELLAKLKVEAR